MSELSKVSGTHPFPASALPGGAIDASRASRGRPIVWTGRPKIGRRPDAAGLHDDSAGCVFARVPGPGPSSEYVALCQTGGVHATVRASDALDALARAKRKSDAPIVACEPALEKLALDAGLRVQLLTPVQFETLAFFALLPSIAARMTEATIETLDLMRFFRACQSVTRAAPWRTLGEGRLYEVSSSGRGAQERLSVVLCETGRYAPGFIVCDYDVSLELTRAGHVELDAEERYFVRVAEVPDYAHGAFRGAFGRKDFPVVGMARRCGEHGRLRLHEARLLTGIMECVAQLAEDKETATSTVDLCRVTLAPHRDEALLAAPSGSA